MSRKGKKAMVIGLDCATPQLVFDEFRDELPNLGRLMDSGRHGILQSTIPPITCPAWMSMLTSKSPGDLGFYGFRNRKDHSYEGMSFALSHMVNDDTVWDILGKHDKRCIVIGVPQTFPPKPLNGWLVTSFLTPDTDSDYTYPADFKREVERVVGEYKIDVDNFRSQERQRVLDEIYEMTEKRFRLSRHLLDNKPWDFFMLVEMGVDRVHHGFWHCMDPEHVNHDPDSPFKSAIKDYYRYVDEEVGTLLERADRDTLIAVVSDHGAKPMEGGIAVNEWLLDKGYLALREYPEEPTSITDLEIQWDRTKAWAFGGYYCRIFLNVAGREPEGVIPADEYEDFRERLADEIRNMTDEEGQLLGNKVYKPEEIYPQVNNIPPDLIVYFGDLGWRSIGSVGYDSIYRYQNDTGPDGANHQTDGIFILNQGRYLFPRRRLLGLWEEEPEAREGRRLAPAPLIDVAPTLLRWYGIDIPRDMRGKPIEY